MGLTFIVVALDLASEYSLCQHVLQSACLYCVALRDGQCAHLCDKYFVLSGCCDYIAVYTLLYFFRCTKTLILFNALKTAIYSHGFAPYSSVILLLIFLFYRNFIVSI